MNKRAQLTLFIIISVILIVSISGIFFFKDKLNFQKNYPMEVLEIQTFVEECLVLTAENSLVKIGEKGGYIFLQESPNINGRIPYYLVDERILIPSRNKIQLNLASFVEQELPFCILNFKDFKKLYNIEHSFEALEVEIAKDNVGFDLKYNINLVLNETGEVFNLRDFNVNVPLNLEVIYSTSEEIVNEQLKHPGSFCLSCLYDLGKANSVYIDMLDYGNSTIFTITPQDFEINNRSFEWNFAIM